MAGTLTLISGPGYISYSRNPIEIELELTSATNYLTFTVYKSHTDIVTVLYGKPDSNLRVKFDISAILDTIVDFQPPDLSVANVALVTNPVNKYWCEAKEIEGEILKNKLDIGKIEENISLRVLKGGLSQEKIDFDIFGHLGEQKKWLTWADQVTVKKEQPYYLYFLSQVAADANVTGKAKVYYTDGTNEITTLFASKGIDQYEVMYVVAGYDQNSLGDLQPLKTIYKYEVWLELIEPPGLIVGPMTFYLSDKYVVVQKDFLYANSLGGFEGLFSSGNQNVQRSGEMNEAIQKNSSGEVHMHSFNHLTKRNNKVATGHKSKDELILMEDVFTSAHRYEIEGLNLIRLIINSGSKLDYNETDNLFSFLLDYNRASINKNFTPDNVSS